MNDTPRRDLFYELIEKLSHWEVIARQTSLMVETRSTGRSTFCLIYVKFVLIINWNFASSRTLFRRHQNRMVATSLSASICNPIFIFLFYVVGLTEKD